MSGQLLRQFAYGGQTRKIIIAEEVIERGYKRLISAIEPTIKENTARRVQEALIGKKMLPSHLEAAVVTARIVSMEHTSNEDPEPHATVELIDATGKKVATGHVPNNPAKQQRAR